MMECFWQQNCSGCCWWCSVHEYPWTQTHKTSFRQKSHHSFLNRVLLKLPQVLSSPVVLVSAMLGQGEHRCADLQSGSLPPEPSKCLSVTPNTAVLWQFLYYPQKRGNWKAESRFHATPSHMPWLWACLSNSNTHLQAPFRAFGCFISSLYMWGLIHVNAVNVEASRCCIPWSWNDRQQLWATRCRCWEENLVHTLNHWVISLLLLAGWLVWRQSP